VNNRFRPGLADVIGSLSQDSVLTMDLRGNVDEVVVRTRRLAMLAWLQAYYDPDQLDELTERLDAERGHPARITCRISDRRFSTRPETEAKVRGVAVTREAIEARLPETFIAWDGCLDNLPEQAFINVEDRQETVWLQLVFDMAVFTTEQVETMLRAVEEVAIEAAFDPTAPSLHPSGVPGHR